MKLFKHLKPYWLQITIVTITLFLNVLGILLIPRMTVNIIDVGVYNGDIPYIIRQGGLMLGVAFLSSAFMVIAVKISTDVAASFGRDLRELTYRKVQDLSISQYESFGAATLIVRSTSDITQIQNLVRIGLRIMLRAPLMFIGGIIMAISTNRSLATIFLVSLPLTILTVVVFAKKLIPVVGLVRKGLDNINKNFRQRLNGIRVIRAFDKEVYEEEVFKGYNRDYSQVFNLSGKYQSVFSPVIAFLMNMTLVAIIYFGSLMVTRDSIQVGEIIGFLQYANNIMQSVLFMGMIFVQIPRAQASFNRLSEILDLEPEILKDGREVLLEIEEVEFVNVSFKYPGSKTYALKDLSFKVKKGEVLGVIGSTGSGKTTMANLLVRFYDLKEGQILINGRDIKDYDLKSLREAIGYTEQKPSLIAGSVLDNITMGTASPVEDGVCRALEIAQADFILEDDLGYDTEVAQRGKNFSGGQKQRISIARALYKEPSLYLVDDSFSALDYKTEKKLRRDLYGEIKDKIMIVITQRATVTYDASTIVLLENGNMVARGTHQELREVSQEYREILESQDFEEGVSHGA